MPRQLMMGLGVFITVVVTIAFLVVASQQGLFGGKAQMQFTKAMHAKQQNNIPAAQASLEELVATFPTSPWADDALLELGELFEAQQQLVEAREMYRLLLDRMPESPLLPRAQHRLGEVNIALLFSPIITESDTVHQVVPGDTLGKIASETHTTVEAIKRANGIKGDIIRPLQKLKIPAWRFSIVVDKSQNQLLLTENDRFVKLYRVATGKNNSTPVGTFKIVTRIPDPIWYTEGAIVPSDSPENILGTRWLGINEKGYGIHGSVDPSTIGQQVTAGCVRMHNGDVEELFDLIVVGTEVTIVD